MSFSDSFFKKVEKKTKVNKETILELANKLQNGNMKDETTLKEVIPIEQLVLLTAQFLLFLIYLKEPPFFILRFQEFFFKLIGAISLIKISNHFYYKFNRFVIRRCNSYYVQ